MRSPTVAAPSIQRETKTPSDLQTVANGMSADKTAAQHSCANKAVQAMHRSLILFMVVEPLSPAGAALWQVAMASVALGMGGLLSTGCSIRSQTAILEVGDHRAQLSADGSTHHCEHASS